MKYLVPAQIKKCNGLFNSKASYYEHVPTLVRIPPRKTNFGHKCEGGFFATVVIQVDARKPCKRGTSAVIFQWVPKSRNMMTIHIQRSHNMNMSLLWCESRHVKPTQGTSVRKGFFTTVIIQVIA
jgi:hypothetical protein